MSKQPPTSVTTTPANIPAQPGPARLESPDLLPVAVHRLRRRLWLLWLALAVIVGGAAWAVHERGQVGHDDQLLCWHFAALKNAHESSADKLLGPAANAPQQAVTPEEAERINADAFLRGELLVLDVRPDDSAKDAHRFVLVTKGFASGEPLRIRSGETVDRVQQLVTNPEVVVEVRDGKIQPLRARSAGH